MKGAFLRRAAAGTAAAAVMGLCMPAAASAEPVARPPAGPSAGSSAGPGSAGGAIAGPLGVQGTHIVDAQGRTVLFHGVNNVDKEAPYVEPGDGLTVTDADARKLAANGFNVVRLGVEFDGLMPQEGVIDHDYIARLVSVVDMLASHGIYTVLDNHQDGLSKIWGGNGFPPWSIHARPGDGEINPGFPLYVLMPSMNAGWDEVWNNTYGVLDHLGEALGALAGAVAGHPGAAGIELLNEPWPGSAYPTCFPDGCPAFDAKYQSAMEKLTDDVRAQNPTIPVYWEPNDTWSETMPTGVDYGARPGVVFSAHDYCAFSQAGIYLGAGDAARSLCPVQFDKTWSQIGDVVRRDHVPAAVTEFGDTDSSVLGATLSRADENFVGWMYWHYPQHDADGNREDILAGPVGDKLVRTYPQATAGTPGPMTFDPESGAFTYTYTPNDATGPTRIYVARRHYTDGYRVEVDGGHVTSPAGAPIVKVVADGAGDVTVRIR